MSEILIDINPNPLTISLEDNSDNHNIITLTNKTNKYIIFKTFINLKSILIAKPSTSFINPNSTNSIEVTCINKNLPLEEYNKIKLLIIAYKNNENVESAEAAKEIFFKKKDSKEERQDIIVNINVGNRVDNQEIFTNLKNDFTNKIN